MAPASRGCRHWPHPSFKQLPSYLYLTKAPHHLLALLVRRSSCVHGGDLVCNSLRQRHLSMEYPAPEFYKIACGDDSVPALSPHQVYQRYGLGSAPEKPIVRRRLRGGGLQSQRGGQEALSRIRERKEQEARKRRGSKRGPFRWKVQRDAPADGNVAAGEVAKKAAAEKAAAEKAAAEKAAAERHARLEKAIKAARQDDPEANRGVP